MLQCFVRFLTHRYCRYGDIYFSPDQIKLAVDGIHIDPVYNGVRVPDVVPLGGVREEEGGQGGEGGGLREEGVEQARQEVPAVENIVFRRRLANVL